jgi:heme exporter protein D
MHLGPHAAFIIAAYAVTAAVLAGLILYGLLDHRAQVRALAELEGRGVRRRSRPAPPPLSGQDSPEARTIPSRSR